MIEQSRFAVLSSLPSDDRACAQAHPCSKLNSLALEASIQLLGPSWTELFKDTDLAQRKPLPNNKPGSRQEAGMGSGKSPRDSKFQQGMFWRDCWWHYLIKLQQDHPSMVKSIWKTILQTSPCRCLWAIAPPNLWPRLLCRDEPLPRPGPLLCTSF